MAELFLELLSEEIPARMQARASEDLRRLVTDKLKAAGLAFTSASAYATPRRLALTVDGLPLAQPDVTEEKRGPRVGAPEQAVQGFLKSAGLTSLDQCEKRDTGKGEFWFAVLRKAGIPTSRVLAGTISDVLEVLPWPKSMKWAGNHARWVRPLHNILAVFDGSQLAVDFYLIHTEEAVKHPTTQTRIQSNNRTFGHRFLDPREIPVAGFADYKVKLREAYVIVDPAERRTSIKEQADKLAAADGMTVKPDDALLDEVTGLVEWPVTLMGRIDEQFMDIPPEVLTTSMRVNQKYFSLLDKGGKLAPRFLVVANMETKDSGKAIVAGNERVLRARFNDAQFFWNVDNKTPFPERREMLKQVTFQKDLGSYFEKTERMERLVGDIDRSGVKISLSTTKEAARLAKNDLTAELVKEFTELQGIVGGRYAEHQGLLPEVASAIYDQYKPVSMEDNAPRTPEAAMVALADKADTIAGMFALGKQPTGSKDPFALRRAANGIVKTIVEHGLPLYPSERHSPCPHRRRNPRNLRLHSRRPNTHSIGPRYRRGTFHWRRIGESWISGRQHSNSSEFFARPVRNNPGCSAVLLWRSWPDECKRH